MCEPVVPPTEAGKKHRGILMVLGFVHMALAIMMCFIVPMQGIYELIDVAILFCALAQMNFCCLIIYIINITINFFVIFNQLGLAMQNGSLTETMEDATFAGNVALTIMILLAVYYIVANVFCFYAYREFKGMLFDHGMGGQFGMASYQQAARQDDGDSRSGSAADAAQAYAQPSGGAAASSQARPAAAASSGGGSNWDKMKGGVKIGGS